MSQRPTIYGMSLLVRLTLLYGLFLTIHNSHTKAQKYAENSYTCLNFLIGLYNYVTLCKSLRATMSSFTVPSLSAMTLSRHD